MLECTQKKKGEGGDERDLTNELRGTKFLKGWELTASCFPLLKEQPVKLLVRLPAKPI